MNKALKIAFIVPCSLEIPVWYSETIQGIINKPEIGVYFLITSFNGSRNYKPSLFYNLFKKFENWWFKSTYDACRVITIEETIQKYESIVITSDRFFLDNDKLKELIEKQLDIIYTVSYDGFERENFSKVSKYGLWYIKFGIGKFSNLSPQAFWEVMKDEPEIGSFLLARRDNADLVIYEGTTVSVPYSVKNTFNSIGWKSSSYLPCRLTGMIALGDKLFSCFKPLTDQKPRVEKIPSNLSMLFLFLNNIWRYFLYKLKRLRSNKFTLLITNESFEFNGNNHFRALKLPKDRFYADPFVIEKDDSSYIFFEDYSFLKSKGHISMIEINPSNDLSEPKVILSKPYHLSYPFIFKHGGEYFMIPETASNRTVELYKAKIFPGDWEFVMNLFEDTILIDVTVHFENGLWWLFANSVGHPFTSSNDQLFLYYNDDLFSQNWKAHPQNPIATHIGNCRPAGRLFKKDGKLYRPAQNNASKLYGYGLKINEIIKLSIYEYKETQVYTFDNSKLKLRACHNLDFTKSITVIDGVVK